jgi:hypothetical protein
LLSGNCGNRIGPGIVVALFGSCRLGAFFAFDTKNRAALSQYSLDSSFAVILPSADLCEQ